MDLKVFATTFLTLFLAEMGDKTQLAAVNLSASTRQPLSVFLGGTAALAAVTGLGVLFGEGIVRAVPEVYIRRAASALFIGIGVMMWFKGD
ncbi:MAG: TMEM165/GDT1 family protein [Elusimicrobiota bacterium]